MMNGPAAQTPDSWEPGRLQCVMGSACHPGPGSQDREREAGQVPCSPGFMGPACGCTQRISIWSLLTRVTKERGRVRQFRLESMGSPRGNGLQSTGLGTVLPAMLCEPREKRKGRWHVPWGASLTPGVRRTFPSFSSKTNSAAGGRNHVHLTHCFHPSCSNRSWSPVGVQWPF